MTTPSTDAATDTTPEAVMPDADAALLREHRTPAEVEQLDAALAAARIAHGFAHDPRPEWVPPAGVVALAAAGAPLYAWQVPPAGFRALYGPEDTAAADALDGDAFDDAAREAAPPPPQDSTTAALGWSPDPADVDAAPEALAADAGPLVRRCGTASDCPAFPTWTCDGTAGTCRCTPAPSTLPDRCGMRDNDCDGAPDVEALCSTPGGPRCMSTLTSAQHCGGCGRACLPGEGCVGGACRCETPGTGRRSMCGGCADVSVRGLSSDYCTFCRTVCSTTARRSNPAQNTCCNAACGIGTTPDPCR